MYPNCIVGVIYARSRTTVTVLLQRGKSLTSLQNIRKCRTRDTAQWQSTRLTCEGSHVEDQEKNTHMLRFPIYPT